MSGAVTGGKLAPGSVTRSKIGMGAVGSDALAKGGVSAHKLAAGVVGGVAGAKLTTVDSAATPLPEGGRRRLELGLYAAPIAEGRPPTAPAGRSPRERADHGGDRLRLGDLRSAVATRAPVGRARRRPSRRRGRQGAMLLAMKRGWTERALAEALREVWAADTCSPDDVARAGWSSANPAWGHCDITALIVNDVFGGDLMVGDVHLACVQQGHHWWNRLPDGRELDLTREQFRLGQLVTGARVVVRPPGPLRRRWEEYLLLRERLARRAGPLPEPAGGTAPG